MRRLAPLYVSALVLLAGCATHSKQGTLAELGNVKPKLQDVRVTDGLEKAMASYRHFLKEAPNSALTPEAMRRVADLSIEKEYGYIEDAEPKTAAKPDGNAASGITAPPVESPVVDAANAAASSSAVAASGKTESEAGFENRVAHTTIPSEGGNGHFEANVPGAADDLENATAEQAIRIYKKLLTKYPDYGRNDQVLYQMSRAYAELGQTDAEMNVMRRFARLFPDSRYMDEIEFRIAEYSFAHKKYLDAEDAYKFVVKMGPDSPYYELALYKLGWTYYKQQMYDEALVEYFALMDHKVSTGYDFSQKHDETENKRIEDTYRVVSLSFSNLGGAKAITEFFSRHGHRAYENQVYSHLGEFYLTKRRYSDAASAYQAFVGLYPFNKESPRFNKRVIEIYKKGGFGKLVVEAKKKYSQTYALNAPYWEHFDVKTRPDVVAYLKQNLEDLASHYHALYQDPRYVKDKQTNYVEALTWYRNYLKSFPREKESPGLNYKMADLMRENGDFMGAATAYEATAYNYPLHDKSSEAGYAAVYAYRQALKQATDAAKPAIKQQIIQSSLKFADTYPQHKKVAVVLGAAADDLYSTKNYDLAIKTAMRVINDYPKSDKDLLRSSWLVVGHGSFELANYPEAEKGFHSALDLMPENDKDRPGLIDNLAASIYKQGEQARDKKDYLAAAQNFLRIDTLAPTSTIRPNAEYDAAAALMQLKDWDRAAKVLVAFRKNWPDNKLQPEVTKKIAFVYKSAGKFNLAAAEYQRMELESNDDKVKRGALEVAGDLYQKIDDKQHQLEVYSRFVKLFPKPIGPALEMYHKMAEVYLAQNDQGAYKSILKKIISIDSGAGNARTDRSRYLAAEADLTLTQPIFDRFISVQLVEPLKKNLDLKKRYMKEAIAAYTKLLDYEVADVTAASTYYMAEIYLGFKKALLASERPKNLNKVEMDQYEMALEDQAYPFEDKAIKVHQKNIELLHSGIYSPWIDKSIAELAKLYPAAYARTEEHTGYINSINSFDYVVREPVRKTEEKKDGQQSSSKGGSQVTAVAASDGKHG